MWFYSDSGKDIAFSPYYSAIEPWAASGTSMSISHNFNQWPECLKYGRFAKQVLTINIDSTTPVLVEPGRYARISGSVHYTDYWAPFDGGCNDYSRHVNYPLSNSPYICLYKDNVLVAEEVSTGTPDVNTGREPCSDGVSTDIVKSSSVTEAFVGELVTYTINYENLTASNFSNYTIWDSVPACVSVVNQGGATLNGDMLVWDLGTLAPVSYTHLTLPTN